jgi:hypothetical protein
LRLVAWLIFSPLAFGRFFPSSPPCLQARVHPVDHSCANDSISVFQRGSCRGEQFVDRAPYVHMDYELPTYGWIIYASAPLSACSTQLNRPPHLRQRPSFPRRNAKMPSSPLHPDRVHPHRLRERPGILLSLDPPLRCRWGLAKTRMRPRKGMEAPWSREAVGSQSRFIYPADPPSTIDLVFSSFFFLPQPWFSPYLSPHDVRQTGSSDTCVLENRIVDHPRLDGS